jgi:two-component system, OmpR family, response regulator
MGPQSRHTRRLRRSQPDPLNDLVVDLSRREVRWRNDAIRLTKLDFDLIACLAQRPIRAWSFEELLEQVWNAPHRRDRDLVHAAVRRLRQHLRRVGAPVIIESIYGYGFILKDMSP